jgi:hypothetical protein
MWEPSIVRVYFPIILRAAFYTALQYVYFTCRMLAVSRGPYLWKMHSIVRVTSFVALVFTVQVKGSKSALSHRSPACHVRFLPSADQCDQMSL